MVEKYFTKTKSVYAELPLIMLPIHIFYIYKLCLMLMSVTIIVTDLLFTETRSAIIINFKNHSKIKFKYPIVVETLLGIYKL